jgi:hypothetical protein
VEQAILDSLHGTPLSGATVRFANGHITIGNVPETHLARLGRVLSALKVGKNPATT